MSLGKPKQFLDDNKKVLKNSISEKVFLEINGAQQGAFIKGENLDNPIILYLHGGMPDYFLTEKYPTRLEKNFIVVWWEQRGCGLSYDSYLTANSSLEQLVDDTIALTKYLLERFNEQKIYLMAHSGGTFLGVNVIDKAPELYKAYIGIAQISDQRKSEKIAFDYMLNKYQELGNRKMVKSLKQISLGYNGDIPDAYVKIRDTAMHELGIGTMKKINNLITDLFIPSLFFSEYTLSEKYNLWVNKSKSGISQNWERMINTNLMKSKNSFQIPIYLFHGVYDYTCSYQLAKEYFAQIKAPVKGFYTFYKSAHSPIFEESTEMNKILVSDVMNLRTELADKIFDNGD
jgi:pimeloyl-ACP methyl ester carboxylesterase